MKTEKADRQMTPTVVMSYNRVHT